MDFEEEEEEEEYYNVMAETDTTKHHRPHRHHHKKRRKEPKKIKLEPDDGNSSSTDNDASRMKIISWEPYNPSKSGSDQSRSRNMSIPATKFLFQKRQKILFEHWRSSNPALKRAAFEAIRTCSSTDPNQLIPCVGMTMGEIAVANVCSSRNTEKRNNAGKAVRKKVKVISGAEAAAAAVTVPPTLTDLK